MQLHAHCPLSVRPPSAFEDDFGYSPDVDEKVAADWENEKKQDRDECDDHDYPAP